MRRFTDQYWYEATATITEIYKSLAKLNRSKTEIRSGYELDFNESKEIVEQHYAAYSDIFNKIKAKVKY